jgi:putative hydrolase of the HAD superfamily
VIFYQERPFSLEEFRAYMFEQSQPYQEMIDLVCGLKAHYNLKIAAVSNEGRELTIYRIQKFELGKFIDFFVSSCFVHYRKPDADIFRIALDIAQVPPAEVVYIEDRLMFVEIARNERRELNKNTCAVESSRKVVVVGNTQYALRMC